MLPEKNKFDLDEHGRFEYDILDQYWIDTNKVPYLIKYNLKLAGFILIDKSTLLGSVSSTYQISEFFILRKYRKQGIGTMAVSFDFEKPRRKLGSSACF